MQLGKLILTSLMLLWQDCKFCDITLRFKLCWIPESLSKTVFMSHFCQKSYSRITKGWFLIFILTSDATDWTEREMSLTICERPQSELKLDYLSAGLERGTHCDTVLWYEKLSELNYPHCSEDSHNLCFASFIWLFTNSKQNLYQ